MGVSERIINVQIKGSIAELAEESLAARVLAASAERDAAAADVEKAHAAVEAAQRELAGAEAGDGRDESNRSMQERLSDAQNAQVCLLTTSKDSGQVWGLLAKLNYSIPHLHHRSVCRRRPRLIQSKRTRGPSTCRSSLQSSVEHWGQKRRRLASCRRS